MRFLGCLDKNLFINLCMKFSRYKSHFVLRTHALEVALQLLMTIRSKNKFAHVFANSLYKQVSLANGDGEIRTLDPLLARQVLSQLSYTPMDAGLPS